MQPSPDPGAAGTAPGPLDAATMLRPGLLEGIAVLLAGPAPDARREALADAVAGACSALGATLARCSAPAARAPNPDREPAHTNVRSSPEEGEAAGERAVRIALEELGRIDLLVVDAATATTPAEADALGECLRSAWTLTRSVFNLAFLPAQSGRLVYVAPREGSYPYAGAARAGLENLARTLSIEWARHGVTAVTIAPGRLTPAGEVAALAAYLASPAGAYFSGCVLDLRGGGSSAAHPAE